MRATHFFNRSVLLRNGGFLVAAVLAPALSVSHVHADVCSGYRPACETVYTMQPVTTYRLVCDTVYEEREVTTYTPVWERQMRERCYSVAKPVTQTVLHEERSFVMRPVWETVVQDCSYNRVRNVVEQHEREERVTVTRPVWTVEQQEQRQQVRKYVTETIPQPVQQVRHEPVTTYHASQVDRGRYETRTVQKPGFSLSHLRWAPGAWGVNPETGHRRYDIPGLVWAKNPAPVRTVTQRVWVPNLVTVQVPKTTYRRVVTTVNVPRQTGRWVVEEVVRTVPVRVCKIVSEQQVRKVPYTTCRQVVERVEQKVPVKVCKWVREEQVRKVPVTYTRMMYEQRVEQVAVHVCKMIATRKKVLVPCHVQRLVPVESCQPFPTIMMTQVPCSL